MTERERLEALAESWGVLTAYTDLNGAQSPASDESLRAVLHALGADVDRVDAALVDRRRTLAAGVPPSVIVAWKGQARRVRLSGSAATLHLEGGGAVELPVADGHLRLGGDLPIGLHTLQAGDRSCTVIVAPQRSWAPEHDPPGWGLFVPHHALHDAHSRGLADTSTLRRLGDWAADKGATVLGTLPLLATFLGGGAAPFEPSPYAPVSRRFFGEHVVDVTATPEWDASPAARALLAAATADGRLAALRSGEHVDPAGSWALQRELLVALTTAALRDEGRRQALEAWVADDEHRALYAWFRAKSEAAGAWPTWADEDRDVDSVAVRPEVLHPPDDDPAWVWRYAQWVAQSQLAALRDHLGAAGVELYLDLPIGQHPDGFDTWLGQSRVFVTGASVGAPPDAYFPSGQDWGFPPALPEQRGATRTTAQARAAFDAGPWGQLWGALQAHTHLAHRLRLDHVMGLYRLYWVPRGLGARQGVYVRYDAEVGWALITLASHRHRCAIVGENLGMVPPEITEALERHAVRGMAVAQFALQPDPAAPLALPPPGTVASLNTHDTPTFAGWWAAEDLDTQRDLGWLTPDREAHERYWRAQTAEAVATLAANGALADHDVPQAQATAAALYRALADSDAHIVLVNLEDLWGEARPHNVPGTWRERPNWLRRAALPIEDVTHRDDVTAVLADLREARPR